MTDDELLNSFVARADPDSFRRLVDRYTPLVYAAARRQVGGDSHLAEDVTQAVFILLARKAKSLRGRGASLAGWLVNTTRLSARAALRGENRRKLRELHAARVKSASEPHAMPPPSHADDAQQQIEERIDDALCRLGQTDRTAVTLRYLQGKSQREVASAMGCTEAAAAQRISRAMSKLRRFFGGRGEVLSVAVLGEVMLKRLFQAAPQPPAYLASAAADAGLAGLAGGATASAAAAELIAHGVASAMRRKVAALLTAVAAATTALIVVGTIFGSAWANRSSPQGLGNPASTSAQNAGPIRAGVFISARTAIPKPPKANAWYEMFRIVDELKVDGEDDIELIPIIEPGTAEQPQEKRLLAHYFPGKTPMIVTDTASLKTLDVIVATQAHTPPKAALESIDQAVQSGTGLFVRRCLGVCNRQARPLVTQLMGLASNANGLATTKGQVDCVVVGSHPILGKLSGKTDVSFKHRPAGIWGTLPKGTGVPLIRLKSTQPLRAAAQKGFTPGQTTGDLLYLSARGKGRVVVCNFWSTTPGVLYNATDGRFTLLAVKWAANRPVE